MKHDETLLIIGLFHGMFYSGWWLSHPSEKYEFVNGKDDIPYIMEKKKCLKSPSSISLSFYYYSQLYSYKSPLLMVNPYKVVPQFVSVQLVYNSNFTMVYGIYIYIELLTMVINQLMTGGGTTL